MDNVSAWFERDGVRYELPEEWQDIYTSLHVVGVERMEADVVTHRFLDAIEDLAATRQKLEAVTKALEALERDCMEGIESRFWGRWTIEDWPELQAARAALAGPREGGA